MAFSKEEALIELEKRDYFNEKKATPETLEFRDLVLEYKEELRGTPIQTGDKTVYFGGAGDQKIMLHRFTSGTDVTRVAISKEWVVWGNENPLIRKILLSEIAKIELNGKSESIEEVSNYEEIKKQIIQEYEQQKAKASKTAQAEGLPAEFTKASDLEY